MLYATFKVILTSVLVVAVSEAAKRSALFGAIIASIPLTSVLAMIWLYVDTRDVEKIASLAVALDATVGEVPLQLRRPYRGLSHGGAEVPEALRVPGVHHLHRRRPHAVPHHAVQAGEPAPERRQEDGGRGQRAGHRPQRTGEEAPPRRRRAGGHEPARCARQGAVAVLARAQAPSNCRFSRPDPRSTRRW